ncbi:MAG: tetraacyldisaccharide 4'-kinase [Dialister sp.]|jgi:tetraacyldisaccharide 4'-kinase|uniref:tetraacyldisaccharide 4'-kinase n=2 Tax=Dialister TaxID=39948 RepID=UPI002E775CE4|nr:tetraacyldisaccharide 4'-kinase [Dialister sp.]MEE0291171.1 tetraacyldisaccharide 4'-kinase [Dialister sp.]
MSFENYVTGLMKNPAPSFGDRLVLHLLEKLEKVYLSQVVKKREKDRAHAADCGIPVISVGNITAGGTGKTPCIIAMADMLEKDGFHPAIISRGYRSGLEKEGGVVSDGKRILVSQSMAGDEPYMMALKLPKVPVLVGRDRIASARRAREMGADMLLMDDGFQYWKLKRDRDIVLLDCTNPFGYGHGLPRGLLREPLDALKRASLFILTKSDQVSPEKVEEIKGHLAQEADSVPVISACHRPSKAVPFACWKERVHEGDLSSIQGKRAYLVSGIGNPKAFAGTAKEAGFFLTGEMAYDDHHRYTEEDVRNVLSEAVKYGADMIVTTEKDAVKMMNLLEMERAVVPFYVLEIEMAFLEDQSLIEKQWEDLK